VEAEPVKKSHAALELIRTIFLSLPLFPKNRVFQELGLVDLNFENSGS